MPVKFHGGVEYLFSPLTDGDMDELDLWARAQMVRVAMEAVKDQQPRFQAAVAATAARESLIVSWADTSGTREGVARMIWQSVKRKHPTVTYEQCQSHARVPQNVDACLVAYGELNKVPGLEDSAAPGGDGKDADPSSASSGSA